MTPLCNFERKEDATNYYIEQKILAPDEAKKFVEENWEKTRK